MESGAVFQDQRLSLDEGTIMRILLFLSVFAVSGFCVQGSEAQADDPRFSKKGLK